MSTLTDAPNFLQPGQSTQISDQPSIARYVRIRREFPAQALFSSVQYSFSDDGQSMVETLVLHVRDPKDLIQVSLEDSASAIGSTAAMVRQTRRSAAFGLSVSESRQSHSHVAMLRTTGLRRIRPSMNRFSAAGSEILSDYRRPARGVAHRAGRVGADPDAALKDDQRNRSLAKPPDGEKNEHSLVYLVALG